MTVPDITPHRSAADVLRDLPSTLAPLGLGAARRERDRLLPTEAIDHLRASDVSLLRVPPALGGAGGTIRDQIQAVIDIATVDSNVAQGIRPHFFFVEELRLHGSAEAQERWFGRIVDGALIGNALSEIGTARPGVIESTVAADQDGVLRLDGTKAYSTGALFADLLLVSALDTDGDEVQALVPSGRDGIELVDDWDGMGQRLTASGTTHLRAVAVRSDEIVDLRAPGGRFTTVGGHRQLYLAAVQAGIAANAAADVVDYVRHRARPAAHGVTSSASTDPYVMHAVGEVDALAFGARAVVLAAADSLDRVAGADATQDEVVEAALDVARAQTVVGQLVASATQRVFDTGGASAVSDELNLHRHWRNARTVAAHNPLDYKRRVIADWILNGEHPPRNSYF